MRSTAEYILLNWSKRHRRDVVFWVVALTFVFCLNYFGGSDYSLRDFVTFVLLLEVTRLISSFSFFLQEYYKE